MKRMHSRNMKSLWFSFTTFSSTKCRGSRFGWSEKSKKQQKAPAWHPLLRPNSVRLCPIPLSHEGSPTRTFQKSAQSHCLPPHLQCLSSENGKLPRAENMYSSAKTRTLFSKSLQSLQQRQVYCTWKLSTSWSKQLALFGNLRKKIQAPSKVCCCITHKSDTSEFKSQSQTPLSLQPRQTGQRAGWDMSRFSLVPISWELPHMKGRNWKSSKPQTPWLPAGSIL